MYVGEERVPRIETWSSLLEFAQGRLFAAVLLVHLVWSIPLCLYVYRHHKFTVWIGVSQNWVPQTAVRGAKSRKCINGRRVLLAVLNFFLRIKIRVATSDTDQCVTDITRTINLCFNPDAS
jgi:hypothetical protein